MRYVKQAHDDLDQARRIVEETGLELYAGDDNLILPFLEIGGVGGICVHTHVFGPQVRELVRRHREGDVEGARAPIGSSSPLRPPEGRGNPIAIKAALP